MFCDSPRRPEALAREPGGSSVGEAGSGGMEGVLRWRYKAAVDPTDFARLCSLSDLLYARMGAAERWRSLVLAV